MVIKDFSNYDINTRYSSLRNYPCYNTGLFNDIYNIHHRLKRYDSSRRNLHSDLIRAIDSLKNYNLNLNRNIMHTKSSMINIQNILSSSSKILLNEKSGIYKNGFDCGFLKRNLKKIHDSLCISFLVPLIQSVSLLIFLGAIWLIGSFFAFLLAIRASKFDEKYNIVNQNTNQDTKTTRI